MARKPRKTRNVILVVGYFLTNPSLPRTSAEIIAALAPQGVSRRAVFDVLKQISAWLTEKTIRDGGPPYRLFWLTPQGLQEALQFIEEVIAEELRAAGRETEIHGTGQLASILRLFLDNPEQP
jgi:hypothetical protein